MKNKGAVAQWWGMHLKVPFSHPVRAGYKLDVVILPHRSGRSYLLLAFAVLVEKGIIQWTPKKYLMCNYPPPHNKKLTDWLSVAGFTMMVGVILFYWSVLPDRIPIHFNEYGVPDGWGSKYSILGLPGIALFVFWLVNFSVKHPKLLNVPWKITEENFQQQYELASSMANWLKVVLVGLFCYLVWKSCRISVGKAEGIGELFLPVELGLIVSIIGYYLVRMYKAR